MKKLLLVALPLFLIGFSEHVQASGNDYTCEISGANTLDVLVGTVPASLVLDLSTVTLSAVTIDYVKYSGFKADANWAVRYNKNKPSNYPAVIAYFDKQIGDEKGNYVSVMVYGKSTVGDNASDSLSITVSADNRDYICYKKGSNIGNQANVLRKEHNDYVIKNR